MDWFLKVLVVDWFLKVLGVDFFYTLIGRSFLDLEHVVDIAIGDVLWRSEPEVNGLCDRCLSRHDIMEYSVRWLTSLKGECAQRFFVFVLFFVFVFFVKHLCCTVLAIHDLRE